MSKKKIWERNQSRLWIQLFSEITRQETFIVIVIIIKIITKKLHNYDLISFSCSFPCPPFALSSIYIVIYYNRTLKKPKSKQKKKRRVTHTHRKRRNMDLTFFCTSKRTLILMMIIFVFWFQRQQKKGTKDVEKKNIQLILLHA